LGYKANGERLFKKEGNKMEIPRAFRIARREWRNIRTSLEMCGDIEEFDFKNCMNSRAILVPEGSTLFRSLIEMDNKLPTYGYFTEEAAHVFSTLASSAAERLGLIGRMAQSFGRGYSWVRTGWFDSNGIEDQHVIKQMIFLNLFFPRGENCRWDFNSQEVKIKMKTVFDKFVGWQDAPKSYILDVRRYRDRLWDFFGSVYH
jgi:hypothetical protein